MNYHLCSVSITTGIRNHRCVHSLCCTIWAIPAETTILPSKHDTGPRHILFLQIRYFLHDNGQVYLS